MESKSILELAPWELMVYKMIGRDIESARRIASENGYCVRVVRKNDEYYGITDDLMDNRINVGIDNDLITEADLG